MPETFLINGNKYECEFTLFNKDRDAEINFTKSAIRGLDLTENIFEPFQTAVITINNPWEFIENGMLTRGDGRDFFEFSIAPEEEEQGAGGAPAGGGATDLKKLTYKFVVAGETNSTAKTLRTNNFKTYELVDENYWKLNEPIPYGVRVRGLIGDIIKNIFEEKEVPYDDTKWDAGDHRIDIFPEHILPPTSYRYADLVKYLARYNYNASGSGYSGGGGEGDTYVKSLLYWDRSASPKGGEEGDTPGAFTFQSMETLYSEFADNIIEGFWAGDLAKPGDVNANNALEEAKEAFAYTTQLYNTDLNTPMLTYSNEYFMNYLATGYDPELGEHGMRVLRIGGEEGGKAKWKELFVDPFGTTDGEAVPFLPINEVKSRKLFKPYSVPFKLGIVAKLAEAEMMANFTFYNLELGIQQIGQTTRTAGKFIDVRSSTRAVDADAKLLGTWLVTKCRHQFAGETYHNTLQCCKTYVGPGGSEDVNHSEAGVRNINQDCVE